MAGRSQRRRGAAGRAVGRAQSERLSEAEVAAIVADPSKQIAADIRQGIRDGIAGLYDCEDDPNGSITIETPFIFPNGDLLDLSIEQTADGFVVSDLGETCGWLFRVSGIDNLTSARREKIHEIENGTGVQFWHGALRYECQSSADLSMGVHLVAQAALQMAELRHFTKAAPRPRNRDRLDEWLETKSLKVDRGVRVPGRSRRRWTIDYRTTLDGHDSFAMWLDRPDHPSALAAQYRTYTTYADIMRSANGVASVPRISILDGADAQWSAEDRALLEDVSSVVCWPDQDQLLALLQSPPRP